MQVKEGCTILNMKKLYSINTLINNRPLSAQLRTVAPAILQFNNTASHQLTQAKGPLLTSGELPCQRFINTQCYSENGGISLRYK